MRLGAWDFVAVFAVTSTITLFLTPLAVRQATRWGVLDHPGAGHKGQASPVPYLGGAAIILSFVVVVLVAAAVEPPNSGFGELAVILGAGTVLGIVGLIDDIRGLGPWIRLAVEFAAAGVVWATADGTRLFDAEVLDLVVTVVWIVAVTNALNLLDNMDGLSAGVAAIAAVFMGVIAAENGQFLVATLAIALAGCAAGFLRSNFEPARIYMGDCGSLFLGFMLAVLAIKLRFEGPQAVTLFVPIVVLAVPLFDTSLVTVNRLLHRRNPLSGGRDHVSHRLVFVGVPVRGAVSLIYAVAATTGMVGLVLAELDRGTGLLLVTWVAGIAVFGGVLLSYVPVYETSRRRHLMIREVERHQPAPDETD